MADVHCQGERHRVAVDEGTGEVVLLDHDVKAEMAQIVLGGRGDVPACVQVMLLIDSLRRLGVPRGETVRFYRKGRHFSSEIGQSFVVDDEAARVWREITEGEPWRVRWEVVG